MRIIHFLSESPIADWQVDPDFMANREVMRSKRGDDRPDLEHWDDSDIHAITSARHAARAARAFARCPFKFNFYFLHIPEPDYDPFLQQGRVDPNWIEEHLDETVAARIASWLRADAINVIMTNNLSDEGKITLKSPWTLAHRMGHLILAGRNRDSERVEHLVSTFVETITRVGYGIGWPKDDGSEFHRLYREELDELYSRIVGHALGTMKSAHVGKLVTGYEWMYEMFAQFIITGKIALRPLPETLGADPLTRDPRRRASVQRAWARFPHLMDKFCTQTLAEAVGGIWVE